MLGTARSAYNILHPEVDSSRLSGLQPHPQGVGAHSRSRGPQGVYLLGQF